MTDRHDVERALSRGSLAQQMALQPSYGLTADQEIRARALDAASRIAPKDAHCLDVLTSAREFEAYIRDGNDGS